MLCASRSWHSTRLSPICPSQKALIFLIHFTLMHLIRKRLLKLMILLMNGKGRYRGKLLGLGEATIVRSIYTF